MGTLLLEVSCLRTAPTVSCLLAGQAGLLTDCKQQEHTSRLLMVLPRAAWELYLRQGESDKSLLLLQLIANQCYQQVSRDVSCNADLPHRRHGAAVSLAAL